MSVGIVIQARTTSKRLPNKVILPFYEEKSIMEIIIEKLKSKIKLPIVLATTVNKSDDSLVEIAKKLGIKYYRGSECDVLSRFISCAEEFGFSSLVRICADNPFIDVNLIEELVNSHISRMADYTSYSTSTNIPAIRTHYGLFVEVVEYTALKRVKAATDEAVFMEHVTNYIYAHPEEFKLNFLVMPEFIERSNARFTLDSNEDWDILSEIYRSMMNKNADFSSRELISFAMGNSKAVNIMKSQIEKFSK